MRFSPVLFLVLVLFVFCMGFAASSYPQFGVLIHMTFEELVEPCVKWGLVVSFWLAAGAKWGLSSMWAPKWGIRPS